MNQSKSYLYNKRKMRNNNFQIYRGQASALMNKKLIRLYYILTIYTIYYILICTYMKSTFRKCKWGIIEVHRIIFPTSLMYILTHTLLRVS